MDPITIGIAAVILFGLYRSKSTANVVADPPPAATNGDDKLTPPTKKANPLQTFAPGDNANGVDGRVPSNPENAPMPQARQVGAMLNFAKETAAKARASEEATFKVAGDYMAVVRDTLKAGVVSNDGAMATGGRVTTMLGAAGAQAVKNFMDVNNYGLDASMAFARQVDGLANQSATARAIKRVAEEAGAKSAGHLRETNRRLKQNAKNGQQKAQDLADNAAGIISGGLDDAGSAAKDADEKGAQMVNSVAGRFGR